MTRDDNRAAMPIVSAVVDAYRAVFDEVRVIYAKENGRELGKLTAGYVTLADRVDRAEITPAPHSQDAPASPAPARRRARR